MLNDIEELFNDIEKVLNYIVKVLNRKKKSIYMFGKSVKFPIVTKFYIKNKHVK